MKIVTSDKFIGYLKGLNNLWYVLGISIMICFASHLFWFLIIYTINLVKSWLN